MKFGRSLDDLAREVVRQNEAKRDYVVATRGVEMALRQTPTDSRPVPVLRLGNDLTVINGITPIAHGQLAAHAKIPKPYYDRMLAEAPELLRDNVNLWFGRDPDKRMIRTLDQATRAFLSDSYRPLDNYDLIEAALPRLVDLQVEVMSCEVTPTRLYLKVVDKRIKEDVPHGHRLGDGSHKFFDTVSPALCLYNSEVGHGALAVETAVYTHLCTNLAVVRQRSTRKYHLGARADLGEEVYKLLSADTRRKTDEALWGQIRDVVTAAFDRAQFDAVVEQLKAATEDPIEDPVKVVDVTVERFGMNESEKGSILKHLIEGGDLSRYGLHAAITRAAEDLPDYDRASEFERFGGQVIELKREEWRELQLAA